MAFDFLSLSASRPGAPRPFSPIIQEIPPFDNGKTRPFLPEDWPALRAIHDSARRQELALAGLSGAFRPLADAAEEEGLLEYPHLDVALAKGEPVGFCAYSEEELAWLYVSPAFQRQGVGRALAARALEREPEISAIEVLAGNSPALALYRSLGFAVRETLSGAMPGNETFQVRVHRLAPQGGRA